VSYSLILLQNPIRILAFGLLSIVLTDIMLGFIFRPRKLSISREIPERTTKGVHFEVAYEIENEGKLPVWNLCVDFLPFFGGKMGDSKVELVPEIRSGQKVSIRQERVAPKRGAFEIYRPIAETIFPFSIFKWSRRGGKGTRIIVHPDFQPINNLSLPLGSNYQIEGTNIVSKAGDSTDFIGCREFRTGDNPKHIHWPSTARKGELVVREFQEEYLSRVAIIADRFLPPVDRITDILGRRSAERNRTFEALVHLSAAITDNLSRSEYLLDMFISGNQVYHLEGGRTQRKFDLLMDMISCMEPDSKEPVSELPADLIEIISSIGSVILIFLKWDEPRIRLWKQLNDNGISLKTILISEQSSDIPDSFSCISAEKILRGELRML